MCVLHSVVRYRVQQVLRSGRQVSNALAGRVTDCIGNGRRCRRRGRQLAKTLGAQRARFFIEAACEISIELRNVRIGCHNIGIDIGIVTQTQFDRAFVAICFKSWTKGGDVAGSFVNAAADAAGGTCLEARGLSPWPCSGWSGNGGWRLVLPKPAQTRQPTAIRASKLENPQLYRVPIGRRNAGDVYQQSEDPLRLTQGRSFSIP